MLTQEKQGNVKVVCRFRPLNEKQKAVSLSTVHELLDDKTVCIKENRQNKADAPKFSFDKVFDCNATQKEVYNYAADSVIASVIEGFNGTIFAYGQTSSGKTHTMQGQIDKQLTENAGIVPRMVKQVFSSISTASQHLEFRIKVSIVQLYLQKLRDLIDPKKNDLKIRSDKKKGIYIQNITESYISSPQEVYEMIKVARQSRAIAATNMNERSSRSHVLFILTISQNNTQDLSARTGKLYLVDLAGSEKVGKTGAEGKTLDQAKKINISLTALGKVINALTDGKSTHIPYRDSKLTRVLQQSLGGNSKTSLIVTCSPHNSNLPETLSTLRFGVSAKKIKNKPKINKEMTVAELQNLLEKAERQINQRDKYIQQLKDYISNDLKKPVPAYTTAQKGPTFNTQQQEQNDLIAQLERQLQMERNLHIVQDQQITSLKAKHDSLLTQRQQLEKQLQELRKEKEEFRDSLLKIQMSKNTEESEQKPNEYLQKLTKLTNDEAIISIFKKMSNLSSTGAIEISAPKTIESSQHESLLIQYETQKEKRKSIEHNFNKYEKSMQKKLMQLQNNITQLTHAYYDLVVVQQRWKVDNLFLKKSLEDKDLTIQSLKDRIKDLQDQNRQLQQQKWNQDQEMTTKKKIVQPQEKISQSMISQTNTIHIPKVVKVLKGGHK